MRISWSRVRPHTRRGLVTVLVAAAVVVSLGVVARAQVGTTPTAGTVESAGTTESTASPVGPTSAAAAGSDSAAADGGSTAGGNGDNNAAVAVNGQDGKTVYAVRLKVVITGNQTVDPTNAAVAVASCTDCTTVALAIEGVLVFGDAVETIVPVNLALALNTECTNCQTLAAAYQTVTSSDSRVRLTGAGRRTIADLRSQLNGLRTSGLGIEEVKAEADRIAAEFTQVLRTQAVPVGKPAATGAPDQAAVAGSDESVPAGGMSASGAGPSSTATPSPTSSAAATPTGSAQASTTGSPTGSATQPATGSGTPTGEAAGTNP